ncbi:iron complex transport system substrate-binding protein [Streptomonospora nanhaiensis]|uniref:Iron complex transport system substrate-binding protein n=1 Tax=Streptomonospora nanhaiensis TaxID=1323731 RepID=A0A853BHB0_9ACTN|nr:ABC transporter substrate-binding protein [Streptomonospora nanhaiensis]NYI93926.1 iron complex transport system substrate-binding protein [Streptomonospora nanhaiensis]
MIRIRCGAPARRAGAAAALAASGDEDVPVREVGSGHTDARVEIPEDPRRVVATGWAVTALISVEGSGLVGVSSGTQDTGMTPGEPARARDLPQVGADLVISAERVAEPEPHLIVSGLPAAVDFDHSALERVAPVAVAAMNTWAEWKDMSERVADAAGAGAAHGELVQKYEARAGEIRDAYADVLEDTEFAAVDAYGDGAWTLEHRDAHGTTVPADAGFRFSARAADGAFSESLPYERLDRLNDYDAVLTRAEPDGTPTEAARQVMDQGPWADLEPVRADRVYAVPQLGAMSYTTGLALFDELEDRVLHDLE